jgi:hypothetical protein
MSSSRQFLARPRFASTGDCSDLWRPVARVAGDSKTALRLIAGGDADANGDPMADSVDGVVEQTFEHLAARDWNSFGARTRPHNARSGVFWRA